MDTSDENYDQTILQQKFLKLIDEMKESQCPLPDFKLYYMTKIYCDKTGKTVTVKPFLTYDEAEEECGPDQEWEGKWGSSISYKVIESSNDDTEIDIDISGL